MIASFKPDDAAYNQGSDEMKGNLCIIVFQYTVELLNSEIHCILPDSLNYGEADKPALQKALEATGNAVLPQVWSALWLSYAEQCLASIDPIHAGVDSLADKQLDGLGNQGFLLREQDLLIIA